MSESPLYMGQYPRHASRFALPPRVKKVLVRAGLVCAAVGIVPVGRAIIDPYHPGSTHAVTINRASCPQVALRDATWFNANWSSVPSDRQSLTGTLIVETREPMSQPPVLAVPQRGRSPESFTGRFLGEGDCPSRELKAGFPV